MEVTKQGVILTNNHDQFRIEQNNIDKSVCNDQVAQLMSKNYNYLHNLLVTKESYEDIFQDTYLKLTYNYSTDSDFVERFIYYFKMLKGWYYRSGKVIKYYIAEFDDNTDIPDEIEEIIEIETNFEDLRNAVLSKAK